MQFELRADHDHRAARVVDALAEQVLTEPACLPLSRSLKDFSGRLPGR
ncbi:DNA-directed RNA polymerase subunit beta' domain protein [Mycobacterium xenopi 4042]|uniref:DNA-directed RNA polymerase subunit beta' domain protein n=1 Tax=Mycobacterium xenopi 4042 TaxID=1299334 RepID=X7YJP6_MYCXE|nr:DNA-directed RNA polymerase subunit beta' domain protein [Mycobacterium xenopi 4042]